MALTRKLLKGMGLTDEQVDTIIEAHSDTTDGLKNKIAELETKVEGQTEVTKQRDDLQKEVDKLKKSGTDAAKIQADFDAYKKQVEDSANNTKKTAALDSLLQSIGMTSEGARKILLKSYDMATVTLDDEGKITNSKDIETSVRSEYADLISTTENHGASKNNPPSGGNSGAKKTQAEILAIKDPAERQAAIRENLSEFGYKEE